MTAADPAKKPRKSKRTWPARVGFAVLAALAALYALPSVGFPLTGEQSTFFSISQGWAVHDWIPYRDVFDRHPPGIHFMYYLAARLFGLHVYSIRIFELLGVLTVGGFAAVAAARRKLTPLEIAPLFIVAVAYYFTCIAPSESARGELWEAFCILAAQATISADTNRRKAAIVAGLWVGLAVCIRPEALLFVPVFFTQLLIAAMAERPEPERWPTIVEIAAAFLIGLVQPPGAFVTFYSSRHGFGEFYSLAIRLNHSWLAFIGGTGAWLAAGQSWLRREWVAVAAALSSWMVALLARSASERTEKRRHEIHPAWVSPSLLLAAVVGIWLRDAPESTEWFLLIPFLILCSADGLIALARISKPLALGLAVGLVALLHFTSPVDYGAALTRFYIHH